MSFRLLNDIGINLLLFLLPKLKTITYEANHLILYPSINPSTFNTSTPICLSTPLYG